MCLTSQVLEASDFTGLSFKFFTGYGHSVPNEVISGGALPVFLVGHALWKCFNAVLSKNGGANPTEQHYFVVGAHAN